TYKFSFDVLSSDSVIRNGLSKDDWVERRRAWAKEAQPKEYKTEFSRELDPEQTNIDLATSLNEEDMPEIRKYEVGWSMSMSDTPLNEGAVNWASTIEQLPATTAVYAETGRHWFWAT